MPLSVSLHPSKLSLLFCALLAPTPLVPGCQGGSGDDSSRPRFGTSPVGEPAPQLAGKTVDGTPLALEQFRGQVVLVNVWATWCKPCNLELPELARLHDERNADGFTVLGVSTDKRQLLAKVRATMARHELHFPMLFDPEGRAIARWNVSGYPTSVLVGRDGTIRWRRNGMIRANDGELRRQIDSALAQPAP